MYKIIRMVKRRNDLTLSRFKDCWLEQHALIEQRARERGLLRSAVASVSTGEVALGAKEPPFDGMAALYFSTLEDLRAAMAGRHWSELTGNADGCVDPVAPALRVVCDEHLMSQKPDAERRISRSGQIKIIRTVYRRRDLSHAQFKDYWLKNHSILEDKVIATTGVQRIVATFAVPEAGADPDFDGMVELYFNSVDDIRTMFAGPVPQMMRADEENFVQMDAPAVRLVAEEFVIGAGISEGKKQ